MFFKIAIIINLVNFTGKHLCWYLFLIKLQALKRFPVKFAKFLKTCFFTEHLQWLFLGFPRIKTERRKTQFNLEYWGPKDRKVQA